MNLHIIASGSSGNCSCLEYENRYIFIDAGVPLTRIKKTLINIDEPKKGTSIFITHEHNDHIAGILPFVRYFSPKIYASEKTAEILARTGVNDENIFVLDADTCYDFDDFAVTPFNLNHDAVEPFGYKFDMTGTTFSIATDFGAMSDYILKSLEETDTLMLESNYEEEILNQCSYPRVLKSRISSIRGHLSNKDALKAVGELSKRGLKKCFFSHVSENSNNYELLDKYAKSCKECYNVETVAIRQSNYTKTFLSENI